MKKPKLLTLLDNLDYLTLTNSPLSANEIQPHALHPNALNQQIINNECSICLEKIKTPTCTQCGHVFCFDSIHKSVLIEDKCPVCRKVCLGNGSLFKLFIE